MWTAASLRVGARVPVTRVEGPGARYALWVQGCSIRCPGCCNPHLFDAAGGARRAPSRRCWPRSGPPGPRSRASRSWAVSPSSRPRPWPASRQGPAALGLSVMVFSGYTLEELRARADERRGRRCCGPLDVLVDGRVRRDAAGAAPPLGGLHEPALPLPDRLVTRPRSSAPRTARRCARSRSGSGNGRQAVGERLARAVRGWDGSFPYADTVRAPPALTLSPFGRAGGTSLAETPVRHDHECRGARHGAGGRGRRAHPRRRRPARGA